MPTVVDGLVAVCIAFASAWPRAASLAPAPKLTLPGCDVREGAVVRGPRGNHRVALIFTGHDYGEGGATILDELAKRRGRASFFLTGDFLVNPRFEALVQRIVAEGHFLGPHSDKHLLYCDWTAGKKTLVSRRTFESDLRANLEKIARAGADSPRCFVPPYEHFNQEIAGWSAELGLQLINYTPGTRSIADYTEDGSPNFVSSGAIFDSIVERERVDPQGLDGFLLLLHVGAGPRRTDKFHARFGELLDALARNRYKLVRVDELLEGKARPR
jgi:peptidoglycan/xylan/chitin deacetylase (PgdA/CDA1 family)